jgi:hypothetical protein
VYLCALCGSITFAVTAAVRARIKNVLKRKILIGLLSIVGVTALSYAVDYLVFRYRLSTNRHPFAQFMVYSYDAVPQKSGKTKLIFNPPEQETCSNSLFPRAGYPPCWYLQRHTEPRTDI